MSVAIVDYGSGNLHSAAKAFERAARESGSSQPIVVTSDPDAVRKAERYPVSVGLVVTDELFLAGWRQSASSIRPCPMPGYTVAGTP